MTRSLLIPAFLLALAPAAAVAQSGTPQDRKACNADARRFCSKVIKEGEMAVYSCLQMNAQKLTSPCRKVILGY